MTGPEHYWEAERLTADARETSDDGVRAAYVAEAQVHATLALAAATAASVDEFHARSEWRRAIL
jgi:hypothetical protein